MDDVKNHAAKSSDRAQAQRDRILKAAEKTFIQHGFHAASMAEIAQAADMSPGLIYRYYPGKNDIILAIIHKELEESRAVIHNLYSAADLPQAMYDTYKQWRDADPRVMNAALFAEMSAEATRSPVLAAAMHASDEVLREELVKWLSAPVVSGGRGLSRDIACSRAIMLQSFMEGLAIRALREPDLSQDDALAAIRDFAKLFTAPA